MFDLSTIIKSWFDAAATPAAWFDTDLIQETASIVGASGSLAATESGLDALVATGSTLAQGALSSTEVGVDALAVTAALRVQASFSATETGGDFAAMAAAALCHASLAALETGSDNFSASGFAEIAVTSTATLNAIETGTDTASLTAVALCQAALAATGAGVDTADFTVWSQATGSMAVTEVGGDSAELTGEARVIGWFSASETGQDSAEFDVKSPVDYVISAARATLLYQVALLHGLDPANPLLVSPTARTAGNLVQTVSGVDVVTISTTEAPAFSGSVDAWIDALADLHGLTAPLIVTQNSRQAGALLQSISTTGDTTTVACQ